MGGKPARILLTGLPGCGKTTLIRRFLSEMHMPASGFFTEEIRESDRRVGFSITGLSGRKEVLAHLNSSSPFRIGKYGVDIGALDRVVDAEFAAPSDNLIVVDEIGKMELLSAKFKSAIQEIWGSERSIVATILKPRHPFCDKLKNDARSTVLELNRQNREEIYRELRNISDTRLVT